jgi:ubiquinone biosynthesis protein COQ9
MKKLISSINCDMIFLMAPSSSSAERVQQQHAVMRCALGIAAFEGWNDAMLTKAAVKAGMHPMAAKRLFPDGVSEVMACYAASVDAALQTQAITAELQHMRVHARIFWLVQTRIQMMDPHKEAVRRMMSYAALPWHSAWGMTQCWNRCDVMWRLAGDVSTDMNYYTKRGLLAKVYMTTLVYWLQDESEDYQDTWAFLQRRLQEVLVAGKRMGQIRSHVTHRVEQLADYALNHRRYRTKRH